MADELSSARVLRDFKGQISNADPFAIPDDAAQVQDNLQSLIPGQLDCRLGIQAHANLSPGGAANVIQVYTYQALGGDQIITVQTDGTIKATDTAGTTLTLETGKTVTRPWSFAKGRNGDLIGVNGLERGFRWNGSDATSEQLGITAPTAAPTRNTNKDGSNLIANATYRIATRYVDNTSPVISSSLSPATEFETSNSEEGLVWTIPAGSPETRVANRELWRTAGNAIGVYYFIATQAAATTSFTDTTLTDDTLISNAIADETKRLVDVDPSGVPIARRQGVPPTDKSIVTHFQDRMFYLGSTASSPDAERNLIRFSFIDEPESVASVNTLTVQENTGDDDEIVGGFGFGSLLYVMKERHVYSISFARQPKIDADPRLLTHRGALSSRAWGIHEGVAYVMDVQGCYALSLSGAVEPLSMPVQDLFRSDTSPFDWLNRQWWFVSIDPTYEIARFHIGYTADSSTRPKRALCFGIRNQVWWTEAYNEELGGGVGFDVPDGAGPGSERKLLFGGEAGDVNEANEGFTDDAGSITYTWKSKIFRIASNERGNTRRIEVLAKPTVAAETIDLKLFSNRSATAANLGSTIVSAAASGVARSGATATLDLTKSAGHYQLRFDGLRDPNAEGQRFIEIELSGTQAAEKHVVHQITVEGVE